MNGRNAVRFAGSILSIVLCGACSTVVPTLPDATQLAVGDVVKSVQCEMKEAVDQATARKNRPWLTGWEAAYALTLNITETGSVKAVGGTPVATADVLVGLNAGANAMHTRRRIAKLNFVTKLSEIRGYHCEAYRDVRDHPFVPGRSLGRTGLSEWLVRALDAVDPAGRDDETTPSARTPASVGHTFEFVVQVDVNAGAGFTLLPTGGATFGPSGTAGRIDDHSLEVTFAPPKTVVKTVRETKSVMVPGRAPSREEAQELARLDATEKDLTAQLASPAIKIEGFTELSATEQTRRKVELGDRLARSKAEALRIEARLKPRTLTVTEPRTIVEISPTSAQEALVQLQFERLLSVPRF